jgi:hypothetical protein
MDDDRDVRSGTIGCAVKLKLREGTPAPLNHRVVSVHNDEPGWQHIALAHRSRRAQQMRLAEPGSQVTVVVRDPAPGVYLVAGGDECSGASESPRI